ncbi:hypothetical protein YC2023_014699 [Brassica napus]
MEDEYSWLIHGASCCSCRFFSSSLYFAVLSRDNLRGSKKEFNKTEDDLKSLQSVAQIIGEVLRPFSLSS